MCEVYGALITKETVIENHIDGENGLTNKILQSMYYVAKEFVYIGFLLNEADVYEYYKEKGYQSIYEYAEAELSFKKSSTNNFIRVYRTFSDDGSMFLKDGYKDFNYSQLTEMLSLKPALREKVTSDMTVKEIRLLKKADVICECSSCADTELIPVVAHQPETTDFQTSGKLVFGSKDLVSVQFPRKFVVEFFNKCFGNMPNDIAVENFCELGCYNDDFVKRLFRAIGYNF